MANQEMYKHDALLHLMWIVASANTTTDDEKYGAVSSVEDEYYEKVKNNLTHDNMRELLDMTSMRHCEWEVLSEHYIKVKK
jgi:hypothetical protein